MGLDRNTPPCPSPLLLLQLYFWKSRLPGHMQQSGERRPSHRDPHPLLSAGSSSPPLTLMESVGLAPRRRLFWERALDYFEDLVDAFEKLTT